MRKFLLSIVTIVTLLLTTTSETKASHLLGGEITWECQSGGTNDGKLQFTVKLYRYCDGSTFLSVPSLQNPLYTTYGGPSSVQTSLISTTDISPECYADSLEMDCYGNNSSNSIEERVYRSGWVQINGIPATGGSIWSYITCCRPPSTTMRNINGSGYYLRAIMYPYTPPNTSTALSFGSTTSGATCYDSSPEFGEKPATIICMGYPFTYNHNATDKDLDSLVYKWDLPMQTATNGITWKTGFSVNLQLPNTSHNTNNTNPSINVNTGEVSFTIFNTPASPTQGQYTTVVKVEEWRCNQKIGEIFRDIPVVLLNCPPVPTIPATPNLPPVVSFKDCPNCPFVYPNPANTTVWAGERVTFYITSTDIQFLPGFVAQKNYLLPQGKQFGTTYSDTVNGCPYPPCATLDHNIFYNSTENNWQGDFGVATTFRWKTDCSHISVASTCFTTANSYNFVFKVLDNWCPAPGMNFQTFTVNVLAPPALEAPILKCVDVQANGTVNLSWNQPVTQAEDTLTSFRYYRVYRADSGKFETYSLLDSLDNINTLTYTDLTANANNIIRYYFIQGVSSCNNQGLSILSDTLATMIVNVNTDNDSTQTISWNDFEINGNFPSTTTGKYYIYQIFLGDTTLIDSTTSTSYTHERRVCFPTNIQYYVTVVDTTLNFGCTSTSTIGGSTLGFVMNPPNLRCVSYLDNNTIRLTWIKPIKKDTMNIFGSYRIYHSTSGSSFQLIGTITGVTPGDEIGWDTLGYTHNNVSPLNDNFYYVITTSGCDGNQIGPQSRIMKAIRLSITDMTDEAKNLAWNPTITPPITTNPYGIYRDLGGSYVGIGTQPNGNEFWFDTLYLCNQIVNYYVSQQDGMVNCISNSNTDSVLFRDITPPVKQFVDSVSIRSDSSLIMGWTPNSSSDVAFYVVYDCKSNNIIDTVTNVTNYNVGKVSGIKSYGLYAVDSCGNFLQDYDCEENMELGLILDYCDGEVYLNWNHYSDFNDVEYRVFVSKNGGSYQETDKTVKNSYRYEIDESSYCFYIQAWEDFGNGPRSSTSYIGCITPDAINFPDYAYLSYVSVHSQNTIRISMDIDLTGDIGEYWVKRSTDNIDYHVIATILIPDPLTPADSSFQFEDNDVNTDLRDYFYKIDVINPCGDVSITTNLGRSIFLNVRNDDMRNNNFLHWNKYDEWKGGVISYNLYRGSDYNNMSFVKTLWTKDFNQTDGMTFDGEYYYYVDDISRETKGNGNFCYQIVANEGSGTFRNKAISKSNISCIIHNLLIHIPNSFTPNGDGKNDIFLPLISFSDFSGYSMEVWNRWGENLFSTNDYTVGWDGNGISQGVYIYVIKLKQNDGINLEYRGTISLLR